MKGTKRLLKVWRSLTIALSKKIKVKIADNQARFECKGQGKNNKHWYGYKRHISVDMQSGLINKVAVTPANVPDAKARCNIRR